MTAYIRNKIKVNKAEAINIFINRTEMIKNGNFK